MSQHTCRGQMCMVRILRILCGTVLNGIRCAVHASHAQLSAIFLSSHPFLQAENVLLDSWENVLRHFPQEHRPSQLD